MKSNTTITLTFGEVCENHAGMQQLGKIASKGFTKEELEREEVFFNARGIDDTELVHLNKFLPDGVEESDAYILIVRNGVEAFCDCSDLQYEHSKLRK